MSQSKKHSIIETIANTAAGFIISLLLTLYVLPVWGFDPKIGQALEMTVLYTVASLIRGYGMRRLFNYLA